MVFRDKISWPLLLTVAGSALMSGLTFVATGIFQTNTPDIALWRSFYFWMGWGFVVVAAALPIWKGWSEISAWMWGKLHRPAKPLRRQIKVVAPAAVTVSLPLLQPRRYDQDNETIDAIDVENTTDRRQFRAGVLFLYGSERELCTPARKDHALLWEGTDDIRRWLSKGETGQLLLGRWLEDENKNRVFWFEHAYGVSVGGQEVSGAVRGPLQQTRVTDKNRRTLLFQLRLTTTPPIPQGIVTQNYKFSWSGGLEPQGSLGVDPSAEIAARPETTQKQQPTTVHSDARPVLLPGSSIEGRL